MAYEIDFLPVGEGEKSGDAIAMRFGNLTSNPPQQRVVVIDGGTKKSGAALVEHINGFYKTNSVDAVICTHSDADHASGLTEVLDNCDVKSLWMHLPWKHLADVDNLLKNAEMSNSDLKKHFKKSLDNAHDLESLANKKQITIFEPFSDKSAATHIFCVLGPSTRYYTSLLESFRCADELVSTGGFQQKLSTRLDKAAIGVPEIWERENLIEPGEGDCTAENNSSAIMLFTNGDSKFLFTSDAGVLALSEAASRAAMLGIDLKTVEAFQIPHHGSKHNVGPEILDRIIGPKRRDPSFTKTAIVSASKEDSKHPSKRVVNALMRRGARVFPTHGGIKCYHGGDVPARNWGNATPYEFFAQVEE